MPAACTLKQAGADPGAARRPRLLLDEPAGGRVSGDGAGVLFFLHGVAFRRLDTGRLITKGGTTVSQATMNQAMTSMFYRMLPVVHRSAPNGSDVEAQKHQTDLDILR